LLPCSSALQPLIVPRVIAEVSGNDLMYLLQRPGEVIAMLVDEVEKHGFDGLVGCIHGQGISVMSEQLQHCVLAGHSIYYVH
jgi:hypothetical protein